MRGAAFAAAVRRQAKHPCFVLVPHAPKLDSWGNLYDEGLQGMSEGLQGPSKSLRVVMEVLDVIETEFSIDKKREYITGLSNGGKGTWAAITSRPDRFAAAIPLCARHSFDPASADLSKWAGLVAHMPIWMFHGTMDPQCDVENSRGMIKALKDAGSDARYTEVPDAKHNCWDTAYAMDDLHEWLFAQSLTNVPGGRTGSR